MEFTCRRLNRNELDAYVDLRLVALQTAPEAFGTRHAETVSRGSGHLADTCFGDDAGALFGAFTPEGAIVSQMSVYRPAGNRRHIAGIGNVFTHPEYRGRGLTTRLMELAIDHVRGFDEIRRLEISVNAENPTALAIYQLAGFIAWGREPDALRLNGRSYDEIHLSITLIDDEA